MMLKPIYEEIRDLLRRGTFKIISREEVLDGAYVLTARFVLAIKSKKNGSARIKARYVIGVHRDILKNILCTI